MFFVSLQAAAVESQPNFDCKMCLINQEEKQISDHMKQLYQTKQQTHTTKQKNKQANVYVVTGLHLCKTTLGNI